jgi:ABC transport system ATP-binding/permease protein
MNFLTLEQISKSYGEKMLFKDLALYINKGDKVALVAKNGTGKSSLLRVVAGVEAAEMGGKVELHKSVRTAFLDQEPDMEPHLSILDVIFDESTPQLRAISRYEKAMLLNAESQEMQDALSDMEEQKAWEYEHRAKEVLTRLRIENWGQLVGTLSGGQRKRVALAKVIIEEPDFLILDEPTNHLDMDMIEWLEEYLQKPNLTLFLVTHDRFFLENVCNQILELDDTILYKYKGNYSYFLEKKGERELNMSANLEKTKALYKSELEWVRRMPQARGTKAKSRVDAFQDIKEKASKRLNTDQVELEINGSRLGSKVVEFYNVGKGYDGRTLISGFEYKFKRMERVGIVGKNGAGKSTLLKLITGQEIPDTGKVVIGDTVVFGYYGQDGLQMKVDKKVIDVVKDIAEFIPLTKGRKLTAVQLLERFLFPPFQHYQFVSTLSGGERRRLYLLSILMKNPNFLILDEPTNDLDVLTLNVLEDFIEDFPGVVVIVSHDRYFLDKIVDHLFVFEGNGKILDFNGKYQEYRSQPSLPPTPSRGGGDTRATLPLTNPSVSPSSGAAGSSFGSKELNRLEKEIQKLTDKKNKLADEYNDYEKLSPERIIFLGKEIESLNAQIEEKEMRWLELA